MPDEKDFQKKVQRIGELVADLEKIADPETRASAKALVQLLLDLHATGLERVMEIVAKNEDTGPQTIDDLGQDPLVGSLLVLYGLHPLNLEDRVAQAVKKVAPRVRKNGAEVELLDIVNGIVRVQIEVTGHACGSNGNTLKTLVEDALYEGAPDIDQLIVEGLSEPAGNSGFVPLGKLGGITVAAN